MKTRCLRLCTLAGFVLLAGCQSAHLTAARIQEKSALFAALPADKQQKLRDGIVEVGDTADMVYIALGQPNRAEITADGTVGVWTYENFYPSAAVSPHPLYAVRPHVHSHTMLDTGPSDPGMRDGVINEGPMMGATPQSVEASRNVSGVAALPDLRPVTLRLAFREGRVFHLGLEEHRG